VRVEQLHHFKIELRFQSIDSSADAKIP